MYYKFCLFSIKMMNIEELIEEYFSSEKVIDDGERQFNGLMRQASEHHNMYIAESFNNFFKDPSKKYIVFYSCIGEYQLLYRRDDIMYVVFINDTSTTDYPIYTIINIFKATKMYIGRYYIGLEEDDFYRHLPN